MDAPATLKPAEVAAFFVKAGIAKHKDRYESVFMKAVLAGVMLSFGGLLSQIVSAGSPALTQSNPGLAKILAGFVFPCGLVMIVLQGFELLTSNMMVLPMAVLKREVPMWSLCLNFLLVFFGNLVGSLFFAAVLVHYTGIISVEPYLTAIRTVHHVGALLRRDFWCLISYSSHKAMDPQWHQIFLRGIGCNWLVCVAVWQAAGARETSFQGKEAIFAIWIPIWLFVACSVRSRSVFVANMYSIPLGIMLGANVRASPTILNVQRTDSFQMSVAAYIRKSLIASLLGNMVGALFVALPAVYFHLHDFNAGGLKAAEAGEVHHQDGSSDNMSERKEVGTRRL
ncbi:Formate/nitrite transporter [Mycena rebaudengoi]|nr:Formate/nitrite transporter [Mycena rebaudengoi]